MTEFYQEILIRLLLYHVFVLSVKMLLEALSLFSLCSICTVCDKPDWVPEQIQKHGGQ